MSQNVIHKELLNRTEQWPTLKPIPIKLESSKCLEAIVELRSEIKSREVKRRVSTVDVKNADERFFSVDANVEELFPPQTK